MVSQLVGVEVRLLVESLVAALERAHKGLLSSVDPHMGLQVEVQ